MTTLPDGDPQPKQPVDEFLERLTETCERAIPAYHHFIEEMNQGLQALQIQLSAEAKTESEIPAQLKAELAATKVALQSAIAEATAAKTISAQVTEEKEETFQRRQPTEQKKQVKRPEKTANQTLYKILVVDDAEINRVLMGHYFKPLPVRVDFSSSGEDAVLKCQTAKFDLIIMDLQMKGLSGVETSQKIRQFEKNIPIIAITSGEANDAEKATVMAAGCNEYLSKGSARDLLLSRVSDFLRIAS